VSDGAFVVMGFAGVISYWNYRNFITKDFLRSEGHYRLQDHITNVTPWQHMYFSWYRMPDEEFNVYHRFKPYFVLGQVDYSKEVLIPKTRIHPVTKEKMYGYDIINPLYCYEGGKISWKNVFESKDKVKIERAAIIINRGWIPE